MVIKQKNQKLEQLFSDVDLPQLMEYIPGVTFIKDREGTYFEIHGDEEHVSSKLEIIGKTDYEMPWKDEADQLRENDKKVMESKRKMTFIEKIEFVDKKFITVCSIKAPLFDKNGEVIGIIGHATKIDSIQDQLHNIS